MTRTAFVTGADRGLGFALCTGLLEQDWEVFAGQYMSEWHDLSTLADKYPNTLHMIPLDVSSEDSTRAAARAVMEHTDHIDLLINNAGIYAPVAERPIRELQDYNEMLRMYDVNALGSLRITEAFLPLTDHSDFKRLCFVSSEAGSITRAWRKAWFGYCMSKAALNMAVQILFNDLHPAGYTFRVYHPGWIRSYMLGEKNLEATFEPEEAAAKAIPIFLGNQKDEGKLTFIDYDGNEWPW
jgi:NAD(P)-dependent dehydrogenase (short-subunit alcohol dehydrogenase family)